MHMAKGFLFFLTAALLLLGLLGYFLLSEQLLKILSLALIGLAVVLLIVLFFSGSRSSRMRKLLQEMEHRLLQESAEDLKSIYLDAYNTYVKLSEKEKTNFYGRLMKIRERLEESMKAENDLQELLGQETGQETASGKKKELYEKAHALYQKLPQRVQQAYYPQLMELKEISN